MAVECDTCHKKFPNEASRNMHMKKQHEIYAGSAEQDPPSRNRSERKRHLMLKFSNFPGINDSTAKPFRVSRQYLKMTGQSVPNKKPRVDREKNQHTDNQINYENSPSPQEDDVEAPYDSLDPAAFVNGIVPKIEVDTPPSSPPPTKSSKRSSPTDVDEVIIIDSSDDDDMPKATKANVPPSTPPRKPKRIYKKKKKALPSSPPKANKNEREIERPVSYEKRSGQSPQSPESKTAKERSLSPPTPVLTPQKIDGMIRPSFSVASSSNNENKMCSVGEKLRSKVQIPKRSITSPPPPPPKVMLHPTDHDDSESVTSTSTSSSAKSRRRANQNQECTICGKNDFRRGGYHFRNHMMVHEGRLPFLCPQCDYGYEDEIKLLEHVAVRHSHEPYFNCEKCGVEYRLRKALENHRCPIDNCSAGC